MGAPRTTFDIRHASLLVHDLRVHADDHAQDRMENNLRQTSDFIGALPRHFRDVRARTVETRPDDVLHAPTKSPPAHANLHRLRWKFDAAVSDDARAESRGRCRRPPVFVENTNEIDEESTSSDREFGAWEGGVGVRVCGEWCFRASGWRL